MLITFNKIVLTTLSFAVSHYQQYCHYQFEVLKGDILRLPRAVVR